MKLIKILVLTLLALILTMPRAEAKSTIVGDIILLGNVERGGLRLTNETSLFEGDSIRTQKASAGVVRIAGGRLEIEELSEVEIVRGYPLKIVVKSGQIAFNFPTGTSVEIITPQLEIRPTAGAENVSGRIAATPQKEDKVESRSGTFTILEREKNGDVNQIKAGQVLTASLVAYVPVKFSRELEPVRFPQGPLTGPQIAIVNKYDGDVRVARSNTPNNFTKLNQAGLGLASGDWVKSLQGQAEILFTDQSTVSLLAGTTIQVQQTAQAGTISRRVSQFIGSIWFNIQKVTGTSTTLETPTAVAAIRGTQGAQDVPNLTESTHALNEGIEQITELVTQQSVTIRSGQRVTAIRGIGFTPIVALLAAIAQPAIGAGGGGGAGGGAAGGGAAPGAAPGAAGGAGGAAGGAATGAATSAATTAATTTVSAVTTATAVTLTATAPALAAVVPAVTQNQQSRTASSSRPLNPPGGG